MSPRPTSRLVAAAAAALLLAACSAREVERERAEQAATCTRCHGGLDNGTGAPPRSVRGETSTAAVVVGAHSSHVQGSSRLSPPLGCDACHEAPDPQRPGAHVDGQTVPRFGPLASAGGVTPAWDRAAATCTVYCHGASLAGGDDRTPQWTRVDGVQGDCGSCHGVPPPAPHPLRFDCARCHPESLDMSGPPATATLRHLNGVVDLAGGCATCHGNPDRVTSVELVKGAPPAGVDGETATTARAVGAHEAHLLGGELAQPVPCASCHAVPTEQAHSDGAVDLAFSGVAVAQGAAATFGATDPASPTCTNYCHGATLQGGATPAPVWTRVDGTQAACGACHGAPPERVRGGAAPHPSGTSCGICHPGTVDPAGAIRVANGMHVNGAVEVEDFHPAGWLVAPAGPDDPDWHGYAANRGLAGCKDCHGGDFAGGGTGISCNACHASAGFAEWTTTCTFCHGDQNRAAFKPAPPVGTQGELAVTDRAVGAHQRHLAGGAYRAGVECAECHAVPTGIEHVTGAVELAFGPLARTGGASPALQPDLSCSSTWCHGATLAIGGGTTTAPRWTAGPGDATCGACHGVPPPLPHPASSACAACHPDTVDASGGIDVAGGRHVDGRVDLVRHPEGFAAPDQHGLAANRDLASCRGCHGADLSGGAAGVACATCHDPVAGAPWQSNCTFCHGARVASYTPADLPRAAPPQGTQDETAATERAVGAHARHLQGGAVANGFACGECHPVPTSLDHVDGEAAPVDLAFGPIADANGVASSFTGTTCTTWCHGARLSGGDRTAPLWTTVDGSQAGCGSCHGLPPDTIRGGTAPHSRNPSCGSCHEGFTATAVNKALHVNGAVDVKDFTCSSCHGDAARAGTDLLRAAPPVGSEGETATTARAVGAHQRHLEGGALTRPIACTECHAPPTAMDHSDVTVQLAFGPLARAGGVTPSLDVADPLNPTCTVYCHGPTLADGARTAPAWTGGPAHATCGSCHGAPPATIRGGSAAHPANPSCGGCHGAGYGPTAVNVATHVDGVVDVVPFTCASCHGDAARAGSELVKAVPPSGTAGETLETQLAVGAHRAHVLEPALTDGFACAECHVVPAAGDVGPPALHADGAVAIDFGPLADLGTATVWDRAATTCSASYCHGAFDGGNPLNAPSWTLGASQALCGSCHGAPPPAPHVPSPDCGRCHGAGYGPSAVNPATHVDGALDVLPLTCSSCHGDPARTGDEARKAAPPTGTRGETLTTQRAVGAHERHLSGGALGQPVACAQCHAVPASGTAHVTGTPELQFGSLWSRDGVTPAWDGAALTCTTYCHGATLSGGSAAPPVWTGGASQGACGACHGVAPPPPHVQNAQCGRCHTGYTATTVNPATHLDGVLDVIPMTCSTCHGDAARAGSDALKAAPPLGTNGETATTARAVGAHQKHLTGSANSKAVACEECHAVPASMSHPTGAVELTFGPLAGTSGATPSWSTSSLTCTNYCHGATLVGGQNTAPLWTGGATQVALCNSCHGNPPSTGAAPGAPRGHLQHGRFCGNCHGTPYPSALRHVDGKVDVIIVGYDLSTPEPCDTTTLVLEGVGNPDKSWNCAVCHSVLPSVGDQCDTGE